jgi:hypothetical protein
MKIDLLSVYGDPNPTDFIADSVSCAGPTPTHDPNDDAPHTLDGIEIVLAGSAGDDFIRHMQKRDVQILLTSETDPFTSLTKILAGEALPDQHFDITSIYAACAICSHAIEPRCTARDCKT